MNLLNIHSRTVTLPPRARCPVCHRMMEAHKEVRKRNTVIIMAFHYMPYPRTEKCPGVGMQTGATPAGSVK